MTEGRASSVDPAAIVSDGHAEGHVDRLVDDRFFGKQDRGVVVEVGAARPDYLSVGARFRARGWEVLAIEPNPAYAEHYRRLGLEVLQYACGDRDEDDVDFAVVNSHGTQYKGGAVTYESWSSLAIKDRYAELKPDLDVSQIKVKLRRLDTILQMHAPGLEHIDLVSVDVEGWELEVLSGLDFERYKPSVLVVENLFYEASYRAFMRRRGYVVWKHVRPNDVYVRQAVLSRGEALIAPLRASVLAAIDRGRHWLGRTLTPSGSP